MDKPSSKIKAALLTLGGCFCFTLVIALSRVASVTISITTILFFQYFISMIALLPWILQQGGQGLYLNKFGVILVRSVFGFLNYAFVFFAVQRIPLVNVVLLNNSSPLFIPLIIWIWKKVKISKQLWLGIIVGFLGIALILRPNAEFLNIGAFFAIASAICVSISMIAQRRLVKKASVYTISFYYFLISTLISLPFMLENWEPIDQPTIIVLVGIGVLFVIGQILVLNALRFEKPSYLSSFNYAAIVYGALIEWYLWREAPGWITIVGILIVFFGGLITLHYGYRKGKKAKKDINSDQSLE